MKTYFLLFSFLLLINCRNVEFNSIESSSNATESTSNSAVENQKDSLKIQTYKFEEINNSGILIFPLEMAESDNKRKTDYKDVGNYGHWNMVFYNTHTKNYHLLSDQKMIIERYFTPELDQSKKEEPLPFLFFEIKVDDYNQDKLLDLKDPTYLFVTDLEGKNLKQISPKNMDLTKWNYISSSKQFLISSKVDSDKNKKFDHYDEIRTYLVPIDSLESPKEIFSEEFKTELKELFKRDWKKIK